MTRCWGTYGHGNETISPHVHTSSVLSIAYYVSLPEGSASISFETESHQNDAIKGLFRESRRGGSIDPNNPLSALAVAIEANEDDLLIFPSSNLHGVPAGSSKRAAHLYCRRHDVPNKRGLGFRKNPAASLELEKHLVLVMRHRSKCRPSPHEGLGLGNLEQLRAGCLVALVRFRLFAAGSRC